MQFIVEITDPTSLAGISAACAAYNTSLPSTEEAPAVPLTDAEYVQFVMGKAAESYAKQYGVAA